MGLTAEDGGVSEQGAADAERRPPREDVEVGDASAGDGAPNADVEPAGAE